MAQQHSRCNLSAARFPFVTALHGRTIILPQHDMNFQKSAIFAGADQDRDVGVPQVFYMHNCMPTEQGFQSVGFGTVIEPASPAVTDFDSAINLGDPDGNKFLFSPAAGKNYVFDAPVASWASISSIYGVVQADVLVTHAFVQGQTYIFYEGRGCYEYNKTTKAFDAVTLTGLSITSIVGIVGSNGYLLAWDINGVLYWSSATNPLDFVPSLLTGASSGAITDLKGRVQIILPITNGFIVYATENAVGGTFSGNIRFPFTLKEIPGAGGVRSREHVSSESNLDEHYALTSAGLQQLSKTACKTLLAEASDFITARVFEDYNSTTKLFTVTYLTGDLNVKLTVVGARYFVISYGVASTLTHAIIYDIVQKRWGKVKLEHVDCFEYTYPNLYGTVTYADLLAGGVTYDDLLITSYADLYSVVATASRPRRTLAFLQNTGEVKVLKFDLGQVDNDAVFLLGKFQFTRNHSCQLLGFEVECVDTGSNWAAYVLSSFDGKNFQSYATPTLKRNQGYLRKYQIRKTGTNHSLLFEGSFNLTSVLIEYAQGGTVRG